MVILNWKIDIDFNKVFVVVWVIFLQWLKKRNMEKYFGDEQRKKNFFSQFLSTF